jgi:uncharacterized protein YjbI with pentapeptide repeats
MDAELRSRALDEMFELHRKWVLSGGREGEQIDFRRRSFVGANFSGATMRNCNFSYANFQGADLTGVDLLEAVGKSRTR